MFWFKKSSSENRANRNNRIQNEQRHKRIKKTVKTAEGVYSATAEILSNKSLNSLSGRQIEIVDPDVFFHDPEEVRQYKEEAQFLEIMSDWEIVQNPSSMDNFFSADFEDELLGQNKTQQQQAPIHANIYNEDIVEDEVLQLPAVQSTSLTNNSAKKSKQRREKRSWCDIIFNEQIQLGLEIPHDLETQTKAPQHLKCKRRRTEIRETHFNSSSTISSCVASLEIIIAGDERVTHASPSVETPQYKDSAINREQLKTEALACSIMGAIGKCPDRDSSAHSSEADLIDHYDVKKFFRLDDYGNILLNVNHIEEIKGFGLKMSQNKRLYRRYRKLCKAIDDHYDEKCRCFETLKRLLRRLWYLICDHPRNKLNAHNGGPGDLVRTCTFQLAHDPSSTFARNIENFISCTKESREAAPQVVMRNMRQFMNGMKNYLVKHGEGKFHQEIEAERLRLKADEFLNLDAILETVMHQLVVLPLREHLYGMFVDYYKRSEDIQLLAQNVKYACGRNAADFGVRATVTPPSPTSLQIISALLQRLQEAELPLDKLDLFMCVIKTIFDATGCPRGQQLGADDFLPVLVYVVAKCGFVGAEIEAEFMWGLLQPTLLSGEAGYYLTALCSAVHVLKSFMASENENGSSSLDWRSSSLPACSSVLRVIIPDECNGSLQTRTLPVRPHTTTREVCRTIAHKARITNPQDYALFKLVDGEETLLNDTECPQDVRLASKGKHCMLAYKRIDAKIAWPTSTY
ncbi:protein sprint isoform X7 [Eurosta solidaginis]|uniref:protein sprint isoform X7 n=1 Tax=Eurosta solidaginis TaxID=178769 RepID=UPI0035313CF2